MLDRRRFGRGLMAAALFPGLSAVAQARVPRLALVVSGRAVTELAIGGIATFDAFLRELARQGWIEGQTLKVERWSSLDRIDADAEFAVNVVASGPDVIFCANTRLALAMKAATHSIPIVFYGIDPLERGLVRSLARPEANVTGFSADPGMSIRAKMVEMLTQLGPGFRRIAVLAPNLGQEDPLPALLDKYAAEARRRGWTIVPALLEAPYTDERIEAAILELPQKGVDAVFLAEAGVFTARFERIAAALRQARLPAITLRREFAEAGGFMSYGPDVPALFAAAADYVARILRGVSPGQLPVQQPMRFEFVVNLITARAMQIDVPMPLIGFVTTYIE